MVINSGNINIEKAGEGIEAVTIDINGGNIDIVATDDGLNARGLLDDSASDEEKEAYGEENQADTYLKITGGVVNVDAGADGIDSKVRYILKEELYIYQVLLQVRTLHLITTVKQLFQAVHL